MNKLDTYNKEIVLQHMIDLMDRALQEVLNTALNQSATEDEYERTKALLNQFYGIVEDDLYSNLR